jgi:DNA topoisomerase-2
MVLVNGAEGIGTGWSTSVPQYDPRKLIDIYRRRISGEISDCTEANSWLPFYFDFEGSTTSINETTYESAGNIERLGEDFVKITELPIGKWTENFDIQLKEMNAKDEISSFQNNSTDHYVDFTVKMKAEKLDRAED